MTDSTHIYGIRAIIEAIKSDNSIDKVFLQKGLHGDLYKELEASIRTNNISASYVPIEKLNRLSHNNHQGAIATISPITFHNFETLIEDVLSKNKLPLFLLLDQLSDVRNFGAIIRTAECTGVDGIIIAKSGAAPVTADTIKTSAGAAFNVPIAKADHLKDAIFYLQSSGVKIIAATEKSNKSVYEVSFNEPCGIILGAEDKGVSPALLKFCDEMAKIPLLGKIASLNVSVACGAVLYEVLRQRQFAD